MTTLNEGKVAKSDALVEGLSVEALRIVRGERVLLTDFFLKVQAGDRLVIRGPSGCGKSTLLRTLAALEPIHAGRILFEGRSVEQIGAPAWRRRVCLVPQDVPLFGGKAGELLRRIAGLAGQRTVDADDAIAIAEGWAVPRGCWSQPWSELSGGERQRILLAIAVSRKPLFLLLDEPTSALDAETCARVEESLAALNLVWVTHDQQQGERVGNRVVEWPT